MPAEIGRKRGIEIATRKMTMDDGAASTPSSICRQVMIDSCEAIGIAWKRVAPPPSREAACRMSNELRLDTCSRSATTLASWGDRLTPRNLEIVRAVSRGLTNAEIGGALGISPNTVKKHLATVFRKLDVASRAELTRAYVLENGEA